MTMDDRTIQRFYDAVAEETADSWYDNDLLLCTIREFLSLLPPSPAVLDLGCGTGHEAKRMSAEGASVTGIDFSSRSIAIARVRTPECTFYETDFFTLDPSFGTFDGIFAAGSLIHLTPERLEEAVRQASTVLRTGGYFCAIVQVGGEPWVHYPEVNGERIRRVIYRHSDGDILSLFSRTGLRFIKELPLAYDLTTDGWKAYCFKKC
jgi:SAM-dependent methyltransferase